VLAPVGVAVIASGLPCHDGDRVGRRVGIEGLVPVKVTMPP